MGYSNSLVSEYFNDMFIVNILFSVKTVRIYRMPHVPIGLWFRLIARMISMTAHIGFQVPSIFNYIPLRAPIFFEHALSL